MAGEAPELMRGLVHVIDHRTSDVCLDLAGRGQVVAVDEPWDTLLGPQFAPPFHAHCRTWVIMVVPGEIEPQGVTTREAAAERRARESDDEARETRRPSRAERRRRKRDVKRAVRREERARREEARRRRQGRRPEVVRGDSLSPQRASFARVADRQSRQSTTKGAPAPVRPRHSSLREWTAMAAEINRVHDPLSDDDPAMRVLLRRQRWTGPPSTVLRGALAAAAVLLLWRGLAAAAEPAQEYAEQLRTGALVLGLGAGGVGLYFALREQQAQPYAGSDGVVVPAGLAPDARVVTIDELVALRQAALATLTDREARSLRVVTADPGRLAAALGIDAVTYPDGTVLVVNRTALVMEEP